MWTAITREINPALDKGELTFLTRSVIDVDLARVQHQHYRDALVRLGCRLISVPTAVGLADSLFIEDTAVVLAEVAVLCRPGAASRRPEVGTVAKVLSKYRDTRIIRVPGMLDGGDVLVVGKLIYAGVSTRSNHDGIEQLHEIVSAFGYEVIKIDNRRCLHLKSAVSEIATGTLLINPDWVDPSAFTRHELIHVAAGEAHAANALRVGQGLIYPASFPRTVEKLRSLSFDPVLVDVSELQKAEGAVTCCSLILQTP